MATINCARVMPLCSAMPSLSACAKSLGMGNRYKSSRRRGPADPPGAGAETAAGAVWDSAALRRDRLRVTLLDPSSLRATAMIHPPLKKVNVLEIDEKLSPDFDMV